MSSTNIAGLSQKYEKLPKCIRNLVGTTNFQQLSMSKIGSIGRIDSLRDSIKTKTALQFCEPPTIHNPDPILSNQPIVLVFCQPSQQICIQQNKIFPYAPISYASWLQGVGAKCIPLPYDMNQATIEFLLERSHGLLIPGGGSNLYKNWDKKQGYGPVMIGFLKIWRHINKLWAKGINYPIWGTCLGFEIMLLTLTGDVKILSHLNSRGHQLEIFTDYQNSVICNKMPLQLRLKVENYKVINFQHSFGISVNKFLNSPKLCQKLKITQISKDKDGKWFCSGLQGQTLPIFLTQYHPEKQAYQWTKTGDIIHNKSSIEISQYLASAFMTQCRKIKPLKQFNTDLQLLFQMIQNYKQLHTYKMYKVYAIDFQYRQAQTDKKLRKRIKNSKHQPTKQHPRIKNGTLKTRSISMAQRNSIKMPFI